MEVANPWFSGHADVVTFSLPELLGTKLRALYQRKKGRDLFDLDLALDHPAFDADRLLEAFERYMAFGGTPVTRAQFEANMAAKLCDPAFLTDVPPLLRTSLEHDAAATWGRVHAALVSRLPGDAWNGGRGCVPRGRRTMRQVALRPTVGARKPKAASALGTSLPTMT